MTVELTTLQDEYNEICQRIKPHENGYTFLTEPQDNGSPYVEFGDGFYHYVVTERGLEFERKLTVDRREILYWMVYDLTFWMGVAYELKRRVEGPDVRRIIFARQIELMKRADPRFAEQLELHIADTLSRHPFNDQSFQIK